MANYRRCVFCNKTDSPPSREHVLARWISREFPNTVNWEMEDIITGNRFKDKEISLVSRKPCRRCNNGWMRTLESIAKPLLVPLMKGERISLSVLDQLTVVRWFTKTVIMHEFLAKGPYWFEPAERNALHDSLLVPEPTLFFLGRYKGDRPVSTYAVHMGLLAGEGTNRETPIPAYAATFTIKQLAMQLFSLRVPPDFPFGQIMVNLPGNLGEMALQVWPVIHSELFWPPLFFLDEEGLGILRDRWTAVAVPRP